MKFAQFEIREQAVFWLNKRPHRALEVWTLDKMPGQLISIKPAKEFMNTPEVCKSL